MNRHLKYTAPGRSAQAADSTAARDLESHGFFLTPLLQPGFHVLDAGCGLATISSGIAQAVFPGRVTALDVEQEQVSRARRLAEGREIMNLEFVAGDAHALPFADASFDVVFAHALLEGIRNPQQALLEFHRVTRPGGFVALASADWEHFEFTQFPRRVACAISAYRTLLEHDGHDTRAGTNLCDWITAAGFVPLVEDAWKEEPESAATFAKPLIKTLDEAGQFHHVTALRNWSIDPASTVRWAWQYAVGVRADDHRPTNRFRE